MTTGWVSGRFKAGGAPYYMMAGTPGRARLIAESMDFLDRYLGRVR